MMSHSVDELSEQLRQLVAEACSHPSNSIRRQKSMTQIVRTIMRSGKLWQENASFYPDALQQTWMYFYRNLCEANTGQRYDPDRGSIITWLNGYLKRRLQDFYKEEQEQKARREFDRFTDLGESIDPINNLPAPPDIPNILEETRTWAETDTDEELRRIHIQGHPAVTCQVLILRRLPPETPWETLAAEFGLSISTLSNFYRRQCMPRLRNFGRTQGYL